MRVRFWGTRGNIASPGAHTIELGGNTACVAVETAEARLLLDAGTGLIAYASSIVDRQNPGAAEGGVHHLILSHFHWDHVLGFPFFHPLHVPGTEVCIHAAFPAALIEEQVRALFDGTYSPLRNLDNCAARVSFHQIPPSGTVIGDALITYSETDHSDDCYAIRVAAGDRTLTYVTDHEARASERNDRLVAFAERSDLLIHDAQWTEAEYRGRAGSGHSSVEAAIENAVRARVGRLILSHHAPVHSDDYLRIYLAHYRRRHTFPHGAPPIALAQEGAVWEA